MTTHPYKYLETQEEALKKPQWAIQEIKEEALKKPQWSIQDIKEEALKKPQWAIQEIKQSQFVPTLEFDTMMELSMVKSLSKILSISL